MTKALAIGPDIAKQVFQVHGADMASRVVLRRKLRRNEVVRSLFVSSSLLDKLPLRIPRAR